MKVSIQSPLTVQQQVFVVEYCVHFNGHRAALAAGYSPKSAHSQASQLLENPKVAAEIERHLNDWASKQSRLKERVVRQLSNLAFSDIRDYLDFGPNGVKVKSSKGLSPEAAAAITEVKCKAGKDGDSITFKLAPKDRSLEVLSRHLGIVGDAGALPTHAPTDMAKTTIMSFEQFCANAGYPDPFPAQVGMSEFGAGEGARMLLGSRGYGKTDYVTILRTAYRIYLAPLTTRIVIATKVATRGQSMVSEIAAACEKAGVKFEKKNAKFLRAQGLQGKDHSVEALSINSSIRGRHPDQAILDDVVTPEDMSEAHRRKVKKFYNEASKLTPNILLIGQPVHKYDLYEELRPILAQKLEVPHGTIPELDADLEAQRAAGVDEASIQASYHLKILNEGATPFDNIRYIDKFTAKQSIAFIDPASEGEDYTAVSIISAYMEGVQVVGFEWRKAWNHCLDDMAKQFKRFGVKKIAFETNAVGDQPLDILRAAFVDAGVVGRKSTTNKHSRIMAAGMFAHMIHLSKESMPTYISHVVKYEYGAEFDDAPDSLASGLNWIGLIRGKN